MTILPKLRARQSRLGSIRAGANSVCKADIALMQATGSQRLTLNLAQKALLLVMLPLLLDIILLAALMNIVMGAERAAISAEHARHVSEKADAIFEHLSEAALGAVV